MHSSFVNNIQIVMPFVFILSLPLKVRRCTPLCYHCDGCPFHSIADSSPSSILALVPAVANFGVYPGADIQELCPASPPSAVGLDVCLLCCRILFFWL